ncbi:hypothetical protein LTR53_001400 [Teratosphaeriaceae sp. CCFEE 6253]|nr:hypothetical protein LTR53_001400 [Teratosphaeriaceae sp. CCFEE 6253]
MLVNESGKRPSAADCLLHPWFVAEDDQADQLATIAATTPSASTPDSPTSDGHTYADGQIGEDRPPSIVADLSGLHFAHAGFDDTNSDYGAAPDSHSHPDFFADQHQTPQGLSSSLPNNDLGDLDDYPEFLPVTFHAPTDLSSGLPSVNRGGSSDRDTNGANNAEHTASELNILGLYRARDSLKKDVQTLRTVVEEEPFF